MKLLSRVQLFATLWTHQALRPWDSPGKNSGVGCHFLLSRSSIQILPFQAKCLNLHFLAEIFHHNLESMFRLPLHRVQWCVGECLPTNSLWKKNKVFICSSFRFPWSRYFLPDLFHATNRLLWNVELGRMCTFCFLKPGRAYLQTVLKSSTLASSSSLLQMSTNERFESKPPLFTVYSMKKVATISYEGRTLHKSWLMCNAYHINVTHVKICIAV